MRRCAKAARQAEVTDVHVTVTMIDTDQAAVARQFIGSPTFLVNGLDPFAVTGAPTGITCRIYATPPPHPASPTAPRCAPRCSGQT